MDQQNLIPSFQVDHNKLMPGVYISRIDNVGGRHYVTTFDIRLRKPNTVFVDTAAMHTIEHIGATVLRNNPVYSDRLIYFGPMGCLTGLYMVVKGKLKVHDAIIMVRYVCEQILKWKGKIPGTNKINCGNYKMHDLRGAKEEIRNFVKQSWDCNYPMVPRLQVKGVGAFHDS